MISIFGCCVALYAERCDHKQQYSPFLLEEAHIFYYDILVLMETNKKEESKLVILEEEEDEFEEFEKENWDDKECALDKDE